MAAPMNNTSFPRNNVYTTYTSWPNFRDCNSNVSEDLWESMALTAPSPFPTFSKREREVFKRDYLPVIFVPAYALCAIQQERNSISREENFREYRRGSRFLPDKIVVNF